MRWQTKLIFYNLALLSFLALPFILAKSGGYTPRGRYLQVNGTEASFPFLYQQIYERKEPIDVLFLGASILWSGIDSAAVEQDLERTLGRKANVVTMAWNYIGLDLANLVLKDLLDRRKVRMIVSYAPGTGETPNQPHPMIASFLQLDQAQYLFPSLNPLQRAQLYGALVLGAPRQVWGNLSARSWAPSPQLVAAHGANRVHLGYRGQAFETLTEAELTPPVVPPADWIYSAGASQFEFQQAALPDYEDRMMRLLARTAAGYRIPLVLTHIPRDRGLQSERVLERVDWTQILEGDVTLVGLAPRTLFQGRTDEWIQKLFYNEHLNEQGARYFTRAVSPTLIQLFQKHIQLENSHS